MLVVFLRENGLLDYVDEVFIHGFYETDSLWVIVRRMFQHNTIL